MSEILNEESSNDIGIVIKAPVEHPRIRINRWRVREGFPVSASQVILLYEVLPPEGVEEASTTTTTTNKIIHKLKAQRVGVVKKRLYKDGATVKADSPLLELSECIHTTVIKDMCADCGADLRQNENGNTSEASVPMVHTIPDLKVTQKLAQKLGHDDTRRLLQDRKLVLLVDLDQTVIHTTNDNVPNNIKGIYHFQLYGPTSPWYHTRLRPGTPEFLERMSQFYELHICTFGARNYAHMIAQLLDPEGKFFSHRILSRDECFNATSKTDNLKALFPNGDSMVCIIDDREDVWNMASNLIQVKPYHFFQHTGDINAPPGCSKHELDGEGVDFKELENLTAEDKEKLKQQADSKKNNDKETEKPDSPKETAEVTVGENKEETPKVTAGENKETPEVTAEENKETPAVTPGENMEVNTNDTKIIEDNNSNEKESTTKTNTEKEIEAKENEAKETEAKETEAKETEAKECEAKECEAKETESKANEEVKENTENQVIEPTIELDKLDIKTETTITTTNDDQEEKEEEIKVDDDKEDLPAPSCGTGVTIPKIKLSTDTENKIEIVDPDDYLLYLEVILKNIHSRFYSIYDDTQDIPDLKIIVPKIRSEVLRGCNLVFSGLVPTNMKLQQSRAYFIAKSLGAEVSQNMMENTTHLVAVTAGTFKVNAAKKNPKIKIVSTNWLWSCAERWEHVDERLFPLDRKMKSNKRQPPAHCHSPEHVINYSEKSEISSSSMAQQSAAESSKFIDTINPLLSFSNADLADMNKEFDQFFDSDTSSEDDNVNIENPPVDKVLKKRKREENEEERARKFFSRPSEAAVLDGVLGGNGEDDDKDSTDDNKDDEDDEMPSEKFRRGGNLPSDLEMGSDSNNDSDANNPDEEDDDEGDWMMMGAALEREFLGLED